MEELLGYHYTTTEAFLSMTKKTLEQKDSDKYFEFWASSCLCMNDYVEMKHGYDVLLFLLKEVEDSNGECYRLSDVWKTVKMEGMTDEQSYSFIRDNSFNMDYIPYAISFSFMPEQIPLWSMYADNGKGVCLCFDLNKITKTEELSFVPIIYNYNTTKEEYKNMLKKIVQDELLDFNKRVGIVSDKEKIWYEKMSSLRLLSTVLSAYFKHFSFEFENEYRLVKYCGRELVEYRTNNNGSIIPYTRIRIPFTALKEITIGPCANYKQKSSLMHTYMKYANPQHHVDIQPSELPFRII